MDRRVGLVVSFAGSRLAKTTRVIRWFIQQIATERREPLVMSLPIDQISQI